MGRKKKETVSQPSDYVISLKIGAHESESRGATLYDALCTLDVPWKIMNKGFLTVSHGEKSKEIMLPPFQMKKLLYPIARFYTAKKLMLLLK